jgi:hypothetical protein
MKRNGMVFKKLEKRQFSISRKLYLSCMSKILNQTVPVIDAKLMQDLGFDSPVDNSAVYYTAAQRPAQYTDISQIT